MQALYHQDLVDMFAHTIRPSSNQNTKGHFPDNITFMITKAKVKANSTKRNVTHSLVSRVKLMIKTIKQLICIMEEKVQAQPTSTPVKVMIH